MDLLLCILRTVLIIAKLDAVGLYVAVAWVQKRDIAKLDPSVCLAVVSYLRRYLRYSRDSTIAHNGIVRTVLIIAKLDAVGLYCCCACVVEKKGTLLNRRRSVCLAAGAKNDAHGKTDGRPGALNNIRST